MQVKQIMSGNVYTLNPNSTLKDAAKLMNQHKIGCVIIVDEYKKPVGLLTDRDIVIKAIARGISVNESVSSIMSTRLYVIYEEDEVAVASYFMGAKQVRRLIVLDEKQQLTGVISLGDIAIQEESDQKAGDALTRISYNATDYESNPHYGVEVDDFRL